MTVPVEVAPGALDLARFIRDGDTVGWGQACGEPGTLTAALVAQRSTLGRITCLTGIPVAGTLLPEHGDALRAVSYCGTGTNAALLDAGMLDVVPVNYSALPDLLRAGRLRVDVALVLVPPPIDGRYSLGLAGDLVPDLVAGARTVIAEVSDRVPVTLGGLWLTDDEIDVVVRTDASPLERATGPGPDETTRAIARNVADVVPDGATVQIGLGALPEAVLRALHGHRALGVHSGLISDGVVDLMEAGVVDNSRKSIDAGRTVAGLLVGSRRLFDFASRNPQVSVRETRYTHDPAVLAAQDRFTAINAAIEVDLTGQVNAEVARGRYVGAVGGAPDFLRAAARSRGGTPVVAVRAGGIVARLSGPVSTARSDAGIVVTEHGSADLRGRTLAERRRLLAAIAEPRERERLGSGSLAERIVA